MKDMTCIICPNGCFLKVDKRGEEYEVSGNLCKRGIEFAINEMTNPKRSICSTVKTSYKSFPRLPVRTDGEIPLNNIFRVMGEINRIYLEHPVHSGEIIIRDVLGTGVNIISTSDMYYHIKEELG